MKPHVTVFALRYNGGGCGLLPTRDRRHWPGVAATLLGTAAGALTVSIRYIDRDIDRLWGAIIASSLPSGAGYSQTPWISVLHR